MPTASERIEELTRATGSEIAKVALDTCCVQYYISNPPVQPWADCLDPIFQAGLDGRVELYVSTVVVSELLAHVHFSHRHQAGYDPELDFLAIMNRHFRVLNVDSAVARAAARLRGNYLPSNRLVLKTPDALIGATSLANGHTLFVTNDAQLADALPGTNCIYLRDVALDWLARNFPASCFTGPGTVVPSRSGKGIPTRMSTSGIDLDSIQPDPGATWRRILKDAHTVASAVNEPCVFFVLSAKNGRKMDTREVLFWHGSMAETRPPMRIIRRLHKHLGYSTRSETITNRGNRIHGFFCASLAKEQARQNCAAFASKNERQKFADAWNGYLSIWRVFRSCLDLPQVHLFLCEDGSARELNQTATARFLDRARNILGWKDER